MKKKFSKKQICLAATALVMAAGLSVGSAMAYFTTYSTASGAVSISLEASKTTVNEDFGSWTKHVTVTNSGDVECYVRVKAFAGDKYLLSPQLTEDSKWSLGSDGYLYYSDVVAKEGTTDNLDILISMADKSTPDPTKDAQTFNVIVIQESTPVLYDKDGKAYADWNNVASSTQTVENGGEQ